MNLREIVGRRQAVLAPGAANALFARIIEDFGVTLRRVPPCLVGE